MRAKQSSPRWGESATLAPYPSPKVLLSLQMAPRSPQHSLPRPPAAIGNLLTKQISTYTEKTHNKSRWHFKPLGTRQTFQVIVLSQFRKDRSRLPHEWNNECTNVSTAESFEIAEDWKQPKWEGLVEYITVHPIGGILHNHKMDGAALYKFM